MTAKSHHLSDPSLAPFLSASFDPATYLNNTLSPLTITPQTSNPPNKNTSSNSLSSLSTETQTLLATLNAQATRLTTTLTQLTDDILRTGSRLAYQVDVLRGESLALSDSLTDKVAADIAIFTEDSDERVAEETDGEFKLKLTPSEPHYISQLRLLTHVRTRLDAVIKVFGSAISWPTPVQTTSSFISVSAPPSNEADAKAKVYSERIRSELVDSIAAGDTEGALANVEEFRDLLGVWKGTAEEKGRERFVNDLEKLVDEKLGRSKKVEETDQAVYLTGMYT